MSKRVLPDFAEWGRRVLWEPDHLRRTNEERIADALEQIYNMGYLAGKLDAEIHWAEDWDVHYECMHGGVNATEEKEE